MAKVRFVLTRLLFFAFVIIVGVWTVNRFVRLMDLSLFTNASQEKKFMTAWDSDIARLDRAHALPAGFNNLKQIRLTSGSEKIKRAFGKYPLNLSRKNNGKFVLDIFADQIEGGGIVIQYDLVENKSGNTVWEMGRTFPQNLGK
jgi:hypothetical protein